MRVSVLVTTPARETLRASATAAFTAQSAAAGLGAPTTFGDTVEAPSGRGALVIDPAFPPLPISAAKPEGLSLAAATPASAPLFVTRGTIEADKIDEVQNGDGVQVFADPQVGLYQTCASTPPVGATVDVARLLQVAKLHGGRRGLDGRKVAVAILDNGINIAHLRAAGLKPRLDRAVAWAPSGVPLSPGAYAVNHGTMCAYNALIAAPRATLLDFPILRSTTPGGSVMSGFLSDALLAFSYLLTKLTGPGWPYAALVVNNSWGTYHPSWDFPAGHPGRYSDNPAHPFNIIVGTLARAGADILFAAGNCGATCPDGRCAGVVTHSITGANAHPDVLTLAGCDTAGVRVGYSSQGPAIPGMGTNKPDVTAYTHFLGSRAFGPGAPDSGTSTACPVAAGCVAAIRTKLSPAKEPPAELFATIRASAAGVPGPGWNADYGHGIIQPDPAAAHYGL